MATRLFLFAACAALFSACAADEPRKPKMPAHGSFSAQLALIKHVRCSVCRKLAAELDRQSSSFRGDEEEVERALGRVCDANYVQGTWLTKIDIVADDATPSGLRLLSHRERGKCRAECATLALACTELLDSMDLDEGLQPALFRGEGNIAGRLCREWSTACDTKQPKAEPARAETLAAEEWRVLTKAETNVEDLKAQFQGIAGVANAEIEIIPDSEL